MPDDATNPETVLRNTLYVTAQEAVLAAQVRLIWLEEVAVAAMEPGTVGTALQMFVTVSTAALLVTDPPESVTFTVNRSPLFAAVVAGVV